jgi:general secretion pathway protein E
MNAPVMGSLHEALSRCLPEAEGPWTLIDEHWSHADAQRWRLVLARSVEGRMAAVADRDVDWQLLRRIESRLRRSVRWVACDAATLEALLGAGEAGYRALDALVDGFTALQEDSGAVELSALHLSEQSSPVVRLLDSTLYDALKDGASDLHFECVPRGMRIRFRVDGVLLEIRTIEGTAVAEQLVSRLKVMSDLDIGERRLPQDGRFKLRMHGREIDFRLSIIPSVFGEDAVVRVLDRAQIREHGELTLESLGFAADTRDRIRGLASLAHGMLLVTGPTGSGKTTTLYAVIGEINTGAEKIITIEDPVEYQLAGVAQIPVNEKKGLTFARGLRSILRHDPDRVMVGEIRDPETAQIAVQAALTGHVVFSTVHANNAFDVIGRFAHMGLDLYNVVSALNGVVAQRLMRMVCSDCALPFSPPPHRLAAFGLAPSTDHAFRRGRGCAHCHGTGFRGRKAVAELLLFDDELRDLIAGRAPMSRIKALARERGMTGLRDVALAAACRGQTTLEEIERVTVAA